MRKNGDVARAVTAHNEEDSQDCQDKKKEVGRGGSFDGASLRRWNRRQIAAIFAALIERHGPDLSALSLEEMNETAAELIWEKSDRLQGSKGGDK